MRRLSYSKNDGWLLNLTTVWFRSRCVTNRDKRPAQFCIFLHFAFTKRCRFTQELTLAMDSTPTASTILNYVQIQTLRVAQRLWFQPMNSSVF